jgi:hypothetical protein
MDVVGTPELDRLMNRALAQLELVGHGATTRYSADRCAGTASEADRDVLPQGTRDAPHDFFRRRYEGCTTDGQRRAVIRDASRELASLKRAPTPLTSRRRGTDDEIALDPRPVQEVAQDHGVSQSLVYKLRKKYTTRAA